MFWRDFGFIKNIKIEILKFLNCNILNIAYILKTNIFVYAKLYLFYIRIRSFTYTL